MVPTYIWLVVFLVDVAFAAGIVSIVRRVASPRAATIVGAVLVGWLAVVVAASAAGAFAGTAQRPPTIGLAIFPPIIAGALVLRARRVRAALAAVPPHWLVGLQTLRIVGGVFVILLAYDLLPPQFARPAGFGDLAVGVLAPVVAIGLARGRRWARPAALAWNALGLLDLAVALTMGVLSAPGPLRLFAGEPTTEILGRLPLALVPAYGVPLFVLLHLASLGIP
jgi:hypothetical protein